MMPYHSIQYHLMINKIFLQFSLYLDRITDETQLLGYVSITDILCYIRIKLHLC